jgi:ubiquinol-cytochrome c reductase iron-sulfur subunit
MYDLSARVIKGSPAPHNMAVPEYDIDVEKKSVVVTNMYPLAHLC